MKHKGPLTCTDEASEATTGRAKMSILKAQTRFTRLAVAFIVGAALVLTYDGTMRFAQAHGALGWRGAVIALMNDLAVLVGILWPEKPFQAIAVLCSALTIWANVDHAGQGAGGLIVALVPPVLAILMVGALEYLISHRAPEPVAEPVSQVATHDEPVATHEPEREPVESVMSRTGLDEPQIASLQDSMSRHESFVEARSNWDRESVLSLIKREDLTTAQAVSRTGLSKATINRWKSQAA